MSSAVALSAPVPSEPVAFYADLDPETVRLVQDAAADIRARLRAAFLDVGRRLAAVKELLPHGRFTAWAEAELGMTARTAQNLMVAAAFVEGKPESVSLLPATTLYKLAAASAPPELVEEVVATATTGAPLDARRIKQQLDTSRQERVQRERALNHALRCNPKLTREQLQAHQEKQHRHEIAATEKRERQERAARWRPVAERMANAVGDEAAAVQAALGTGGWEDQQALLAALRAALEDVTSRQ